MFYLPTKIVFSDNAIIDSANELSRLGKKALIVCGAKSAIRSGVMEDLSPVLSELGIQHEVFAKIGENPTLETIDLGAKFCRQTGCDFVIGIGGGSPLDAAKAISLAAANHLQADELYDGTKLKLSYPIVAIPTTHGTGSEVTQYSVLTDPLTRKKAGFGHDLAFPTLAIVNPKYSLSLPERVSMNTSLDALSHLLEGIYSQKRDMNLLPMITLGIAAILKHLPVCLKEPHYLPARSALMQASLLGGAIIAQASTTLQHAIGYPLTTEFDVPHGLANAIVMQQIMEFYYPAIPDEIDALFFSLNLSMEDFYHWLSQFPIDVKLPISDEMIEAKIPEILATRNTINSPLMPKDSDLRSILRSLREMLEPER